MLIYLDMCCLNRPFDDQSIDRNRLESEAVLAILRRVDQKRWEMVGSTALEIENSLAPDEERRKRAGALMSKQTRRVAAGPSETSRMDELVAAGVKSFDALHILASV